MRTDAPTDRDTSLGIAISVVMNRGCLTQHAAAAVLFDIAQEVGVDLDELVEVIACAAAGRGTP